MATFEANCIRKFDEIGASSIEPLLLLQGPRRGIGGQFGLVVDLTTDVRLFMCRMRLWSLLETPIEEQHARLTRTIVGSMNWSGALVSLVLRLPQKNNEFRLIPASPHAMTIDITFKFMVLPSENVAMISL